MMKMSMMVTMMMVMKKGAAANTDGNEGDNEVKVSAA